MPIEISLTKDGPYKVSGDLSELKFTDVNGRPVDLGTRRALYLCRCGGSTTKPFCDGQHSKIGFQAAEEAARAAE
jgi:3-phenylpropionate/trans-cinnamate dioxygenase ferredoxin subunit